MPSKYEDLYHWLATAFGDQTFTVTEFDETFPGPAPRKVLSDLRRLGFVESPSRGVYKVVAPDERSRRRVAREDGLFGIPERARLPYAYSRDTAVSLWTGGAYWTGFTAGFRPFHIDVARKDVDRWRAFFRNAGARATLEGTNETLFGVVHVLHPVAKPRSVRRGGFHIVPKRVAYEYAAARPYLYDPILAELGRT